MKTSCGATLIPTQFTDTVGGGGSSTASASSSAAAQATATAAAAPSALAATGNPPAQADGAAAETFDEQYALLDEDGIALADLPFTVKLPSGEYEHGVTDDEGRTRRYATEGAQPIEVYLGHLQA